MIISDHAKAAMTQDDISEEELKTCIEKGELEIKQVVNGETRYGKKLTTKEKTIMTIYTIKDNQERIITTYLIRRKKWTK